MADISEPIMYDKDGSGTNKDDNIYGGYKVTIKLMARR